MLKFITSSHHFVSTLLVAVANNVRQRFVCKPFNIWEEKICEKGKNQQDWLGDDGVLYYGDRWGVFFKSHQNEWWLSRNSH